LAFCKEALSYTQGPIKTFVSVLFVLTGSIFFYKHIYASYIPGIMMIAWMFIKESPRVFFNKYLKSGGWPFLLVYLAYAISIIYSTNKELSYTILERKLLFPILPLLLIKQWRPSEKLVRLMFMMLLISFVVMLTSLWIKIHQIYAAGHTGHWRLEQSWYLRRSYGLHHGDYSLIGLLISFYFTTKLYLGKAKAIRWIPIILFSLLIFITGSDISRVIFIVIVLVYLVDHRWKGFRKAFTFLYIIALTVVLILSFTLSGSERGGKNSNDRLMIWPASVELIMEKPLFGHGVGDVKELLFTKYQESGFDKPLNFKYNSHNQFLDISLAAGLFGLGTLISLLISAAYTVSRKRNLYGILFMIAITLSLSVENLLSRLDGIVIMSFFFVTFVSLSGNRTPNYC